MGQAPTPDKMKSNFISRIRNAIRARIQITILETNREVTRVVLLGAVLICAHSLHSASAAEEHPKSSVSRVELNTNFAGCIKPTITSYSVGPDNIDASLSIIKDVNFAEGPCVCRSGLYYFEVFLSDKSLPKSRAWLYAKSSFKANLAFGVLPLKPYVMPHVEKLRFPTFKNSNHQPFGWYYIAIGCP